MTYLIPGVALATALVAATSAFAHSSPAATVASLPGTFDAFTPPAKPCKWCHCESDQGNPWRVTVTTELKRLVDGLIADRSVSSFEVSDSTGDVARQIAQIRACIDKRCGIITSIPGSATALDETADGASAAGIPFITAAGAVTSKTAPNLDSNHARRGHEGRSRAPSGVARVAVRCSSATPSTPSARLWRKR